MQNKSANRWFDVQVILAILAMTFSLVLWNLFARDSQVDSVAGQGSGSFTAPASLPPTRILLGAPAPQQGPSLAPAAPSFAPAPVTLTGSSRP